jgi:formylglycine-generating enzyme required for sulfatase activity
VQRALEFNGVRMIVDLPEASFDKLTALIGPPPRHYRRFALAGGVMALALMTAAFIRFNPPDAQQTCLTSEPGRDGKRDEKTGIELVRIPGGEFTMGSPDGDGYDDEHPSHRVRISSFELAKYSVTNSQFARYLAANPNARKPGEWDEARKNPHLPVVRVSWLDAQAFAQWAGMRLPTEAEREYATRAGTTTRYFSGDADADTDQVAWFNSNAGDRLHEVCTKKPNAFGLYDMHGNVWEWCSDWFQRYPPSTPTTVVDPQGPESGTTRVIRGGYYNRPPVDGRSAARDNREPETREYFIGFRVARDLAPAPSPSASAAPSAEAPVPIPPASAQEPERLEQPDPKKEPLYRQGCARGVAKACHNLGRVIEKRDLRGAVDDYARACLLGYAWGCQNAGYWYFKVDGPFHADFKTAVTYFEHGCKLGMEKCCADLEVAKRRLKETAPKTTTPLPTQPD